MADRLVVEGLAGSPSRIVLGGGRIESIDDPSPPGVPALDGTGLIAAPGFIELQVNGLDEADFTADPSSIHRGAAALPRHGVTAFLPTIVTSPSGTVERALDALESVTDGAVPLGLHVEGPFISPSRLGAHDPTHRRDPDLGEIRDWIDRGARLITLAPELPGGLEAVEAISASGAVAAVGHTDADAATTRRAVESGARYATHLFNAMPPLHHRAPGPVGALLEDERVTIGLIGDGIHVDPAVLALVARAAVGRISLVSDAVAVGLGGHGVSHGPTGARLADGTLAGGSAGLDHVVRTFAAVAGSEVAIGAVTSTPAKLLGLDDGRGMLRTGGRADLVLLTQELEVAVTIVGGRVAFTSPAAAARVPAPG